MRPIEEVVEIMTKGTVEEKLACELETQDITRPFLVWVHTTNAPNERNKRSVASQTLFVQHLDACHSNMDTVHRYEAEGKRIIHAHIPESADKEHEARLADIRNHARRGEIMEKEMREKIAAELGVDLTVNEKLAAKQRKTQKKAEEVQADA